MAYTATVKQNCTTCHSERGKAGGLSLAGFDATRAQHAEHHREDDPQAARRHDAAGRRAAPDDGDARALALALEARMDAPRRSIRIPGWRPFQRLNRAEYARAVKDLLGLDVDVTAFLPPDTISNGFDNVADVQALLADADGRLPARREPDQPRWRSATATRAPRGHLQACRKTASQLARVDGAPLGTRGGISVVHTFPADGDYVVQRRLLHSSRCGVLFGSTVRRRADRSVGRRRARGADRHRPADERDDRTA